MTFGVKTHTHTHCHAHVQHNFGIIELPLDHCLKPTVHIHTLILLKTDQIMITSNKQDSCTTDSLPLSICVN